MVRPTLRLRTVEAKKAPRADGVVVSVMSCRVCHRHPVHQPTHRAVFLR